jgi:tRNA(His) guanylyltransferase
MRQKTDTLGDRMKRYENVTRYSLPPRTYTILRVDGRAFHTWTKKLKRPYDKDFMACMDATAIALCGAISGSQFAFAQSDEISLLATDFADIKTQAWFDGVIQKWASVAASVATTAFNFQATMWGWKGDATFDARVFTIPDPVEVENYFIWRQKDAVRNSVTMLAQAYASHKQLQGKDVPARHEIIYEAGDNWAKHPANFKHGRIIRHLSVPEVMESSRDRRLPAEMKVAALEERSSNWIVDTETPVFTRDRNYLRDLIPIIWENDLIVRKAEK